MENSEDKNGLIELGKQNGDRMTLNYKTIVERFRNSSEQWIMPIPVYKDGELVLFCFMRHDKENRIKDNDPIYFDSYYSYKINLLVLHNFLMEVSCGQAYWKYVRCKEPRKSFGELDDCKRNTFFSEKSIQELMQQGRTNYIFDLINKKFNDINHNFTTHSKDDDIDESELKDMGYDY